MSNSNSDFFKTQVLGHPAGLFVLFFTEMWERFSFYGMRVLLVNFLTMALIGYNPGWEWTAENAGALFGTYAGLLYLTPIVGGIIADKYTGYRWAVVIGSIIMTLGHVSMALETELSLYVGLALLIIGTGFFKPTMTSIVSEMYKYLPEKKDGAYTIFYMGVNAGAFFGMMLCGYLAERIGWSWGFGLAGVFMLLGTLQFWMAAPLFGHIGGVPSKRDKTENPEEAGGEAAAASTDVAYTPNPFTLLDKVLIAVTSIIGFAYLINDPLSKIGGVDLFPFKMAMGGTVLKGQYIVVLLGLALFLYLVISRIARYEAVIRDRMIAFIVFAFFTIFFWMAFEQGASSLVIFARDNVERVMSGSSATMYNIVNTLLTIVPLMIITYVLYLLWKQTFKRIPGSNIVLAVCFLGVWCIVLWMLNMDYNTTAYDVSYQAIERIENNDEGGTETKYLAITESMTPSATDKVVTKTTTIANLATFAVGDKINIIDKGAGKFAYLSPERLEWARQRGKELNRDNGVVAVTVTKVKDNEVEIPVSWFSILNSFFIIAFASVFSRWWDSKYNPSAATKYALGLIIMGVGFGLLAYGANGVTGSMKVSMVWLVLAYLFHTLGELCLSPVGLSYVSKLVPGKMIGFMFGMWYLAIAIGNKLAGVLGGEIENITKEYSLSTFFLIFTIVPVVAGVMVFLLNPILKKLMHGVK